MTEDPQVVPRNFKGVWIPKEIWLDTRLKALDKVILTEIASLDGERGCFATNEYLAAFCQCSEKTIQRAVQRLQELGVLYVSGFDGRHRFVKLCPCGNESHPNNSDLSMDKTNGEWTKCPPKMDKVSTQDGQSVHGEETKCPAINIESNTTTNTTTPPLYSPQPGGKEESSFSLEESSEQPNGSIPTVVSSTDADVPPTETVAVTHTIPHNALNQAKKPAPTPTSDVNVVPSNGKSKARRLNTPSFDKEYPYLVAARDRVVKYLDTHNIKLVDIRALHKDLISLSQKFIDMNDYPSAAWVIESYLNYLESDEYNYQVVHAQSCPKIIAQEDFARKYDRIRAFKDDPSRHFDPTTMRSY